MADSGLAASGSVGLTEPIARAGCAVACGVARAGLVLLRAEIQAARRVAMVRYQRNWPRGGCEARRAIFGFDHCLGLARITQPECWAKPSSDSDTRPGYLTRWLRMTPRLCHRYGDSPPPGGHPTRRALLRRTSDSDDRAGPPFPTAAELPGHHRGAVRGGGRGPGAGGAAGGREGGREGGRGRRIRRWAQKK